MYIEVLSLFCIISVVESYVVKRWSEDEAFVKYSKLTVNEKGALAVPAINTITKCQSGEVSLVCQERKGIPSYIATVAYRSTPVDQFEVTSCNPDEIQSSFYGPFSVSDEKTETSTKVDFMLTIGTFRESCFDRKYTVEHTSYRSLATRLHPTDASCPSADNLVGPKPFETCKKVDIEDTKTLPQKEGDPITVVKGWSPMLKTMPDPRTPETILVEYLNCKRAFKHQLITSCGKFQDAASYTVIITYNSLIIDVIDVTSCKKEHILTSIVLPAKEFTKPSDTTNELLSLRLLYINGKRQCFARVFEYIQELNTLVRQKAEMVDCPESTETLRSYYKECTEKKVKE